MKVLRIYHSGVVRAWRQREVELRAAGYDVTLVTARRWNEGGADVVAESTDECVPVRTWGRHPALFVYDPRPIIRLLRANHYDLIDVHEEPFSLAAAEVALLRRLFARGVPFVMYSAQNIFKRYPPPFRWFEQRALRSARAFYPCSQAAADVLARKGARGAIRVIPLGVELETFRPAATNRDAQSFVAGYVGRFVAAKGVDVLLRAVATEPRVSVSIVGDGPERSALERRSAELGLGERARFEGFVAPDDVASVYHRCDVVVVPSLPTPGWTEQFCRVAVEAMASGVPLIVSDAGALPEVVGDAGITVPAGDAEALRAALRELLDHPELHATLRAHGLARAGRYSWRHVGRLHADLYASVLTP